MLAAGNAVECSAFVARVRCKTQSTHLSKQELRKVRAILTSDALRGSGEGGSWTRGWESSNADFAEAPIGKLQQGTSNSRSQLARATPPRHKRDDTA